MNPAEETLTGLELSWLLSPFLAKSGEPVPLMNPDGFSRNVFEYLWMGIRLRIPYS